MKRLNPLDKLDYVLRNTRIQRDYYDLHLLLDNDPDLDIDEHTLDLMLNKLQKDGYVDFMAGSRYIDGQTASEGITIRRNFSGDLFDGMGGYFRQDFNRKVEQSDLKAKERRAVIRERILICWTAAAAIAALCVVVWDMYKTLYLSK